MYLTGICREFRWRDTLIFNCKQIVLVEQEKHKKQSNNNVKSKNNNSNKTNKMIRDFDDDDEEDDDQELIDEKQMAENQGNIEMDDEYQDTEFEDEYENEFETIDSNSQYFNSNKSTTSNLNRNRNENLKLKMMNEIKKSKQNSSGSITISKNNSNEPKDNEPEEVKQSAPQQQHLDDSANSSNDANNRRLSYKEDDLLRKQRLKENLNQLLIEYKHEEEAQLKKSSRFSMSNSTTATTPIMSKLNNRISLDSCYPTSNNGTKKSSAFSLVVPPHQQSQKQQMPNLNSAFRPVNANLVATGSSSKSESRTQSVDLLKKGSLSASSSEASSWSSSSSTSSSSSSSSNSPPKTRQSNLISVTTCNSSSEPNNSIYKKPCLISPRKHELSNKLDDSYASLIASSSAMILASPNSINKSLTIKVRNESNAENDSHKESNSSNEIIDLTKTSNNRITQQQQQQQQRKQSTLNSGSINLSGYLWKTRDSYTSLSNMKLNSNESSSENLQFERYWFSLNASLSCLIYWNDKHEQDLGKFPVGKYELAKCCHIVQLHQQSEFKLSFHQNTVALNLRGNNVETTLNWFDAIKHTIEHISSFCAKCKPKLVVNPMPLSVAGTNVLAPPPQQSPLQVVNTSTPPPQAAATPPLPVSQQPEQNKQASLKKLITSSMNGNPAELTSNQQNLIELESLKQKHDLLFKENSELNSKFKLLEQIHLEAIAEYDNQQSQMFSQIDEMHSKLNKNESELDSLSKRLASSKQQNEASLAQIKSLSDQLLKQKETIQIKDKEIENLNKEILKVSELNESNEEKPADQIDSSIPADLSYQNAHTSRASWNKEVKNLDARITDVLGKLKEREMSLNLTPISPTTANLLSSSSPNEENFRVKYERAQAQLQEAQTKIVQLSSQLKQSSTPSKANTNSSVNIQDFGDDLAKVLMSKEEVITQLEKQLKDREKQIQTLTTQLTEEIQQSVKYQDAFNLEQSRSSLLNNELTQLNNEQTAFTDEIDSIREQLNKTSGLVDSIQSKLDQTMSEKENVELELKNLNEFTRNEIETLQEEIKTLEYKLVHSQRQAHEYQSILEDMDSANTNLINYLQKFEPTSLSNESSGSIQNKLKKNQAQVTALIQMVINKKINDTDELTERLTKTESELNEVKEENTELNDHIFSIDVFMREKDAQCDHYQKENADLMQKLVTYERTSGMDFSFSENDDENYKSNQSARNYQLFVHKLKSLLETKTTNLNDFIRLVINMCNQLIMIFKLDSPAELNLDENLIKTKLNEKNVLEFLDDLFSESAQQSQSESTLNLINDLNEFNKSFKQSLGTESQLNFRNLKQSIVQLVKFINSQDLMQFNCQIVSYMAEQLVHKASMNGSLKFACEFLRKKYKSHNSPKSVNNDSENMNVIESMNEQDEKIFKLASELLLSDENTLRKLSSQVLNEAQHLNQLNWVLNTLRKLRWKHLKLKSKDKLEQVLNNLKKIESNSTSHGVSDGSETDSDSELDQNDCLFDSQNKSIKLNNTSNDLDSQLNVILEG
jgi:hypothetical protein